MTEAAVPRTPVTFAEDVRIVYEDYSKNRVPIEVLPKLCRAELATNDYTVDRETQMSVLHNPSLVSLESVYDQHGPTFFANVEHGHQHDRASARLSINRIVVAGLRLKNPYLGMSGLLDPEWFDMLLMPYRTPIFNTAVQGTVYPDDVTKVVHVGQNLRMLFSPRPGSVYTSLGKHIDEGFIPLSYRLWNNPNLFLTFHRSVDSRHNAGLTLCDLYMIDEVLEEKLYKRWDEVRPRE